MHGGSLVNVSDCLYWFSRGGEILVPILTPEASSTSKVTASRFSFDHRPAKASGNCSHSNSILHSQLELTFDLNNATQDIRQLHLHLRLTYMANSDSWSIDRWHAVLEPAVQLMQRNFTLDTKNLQAPSKFSYSCSQLNVQCKRKSSASKQKDDQKKSDKVEAKLMQEEEEQPFELKVKRFQVQPFYTRKVFAPSFDCSTLFTMPQFTGFFSLMLFTLGVIVGITALFRIKTMDRFDKIKSNPLMVSNE